MENVESMNNAKADAMSSPMSVPKTKPGFLNNMQSKVKNIPKNPLKRIPKNPLKRIPKNPLTNVTKKLRRPKMSYLNLVCLSFNKVTFLKDSLTLM